MVANVAIEVVVGSVPVLGDMFDIAWRANRRNYALLTGTVDEPQKHTVQSWFFLGGLCLVLAAPTAAGFELDYKGEIVEESYMPLGTLDFQVELTKIASAKPDALFTFMPGGMGVGLVKQYKQAGLADKTRCCRRSRSMNRRCRRSRMRGRHLRRRQLGAQPRQSAKQEIRGRLRGRLQQRARHLRDAGL